MTNCRRGHPFDAENTYWHDGQRHCRACRRAAMARFAAAHPGYDFSSAPARDKATRTYGLAGFVECPTCGRPLRRLRAHHNRAHGSPGPRMVAADHSATMREHAIDQGRVRWSSERIIAALRRHSRAGNAPRWWARGTDRHPAGATVRAYFGSWRAACEAAGLRPVGQGQKTGHRASRAHVQANSAAQRRLWEPLTADEREARMAPLRAGYARRRERGHAEG